MEELADSAGIAQQWRFSDALRVAENIGSTAGNPWNFLEYNPAAIDPIPKCDDAHIQAYRDRRRRNVS
jgi:hypothetical protein